MEELAFCSFATKQADLKHSSVTLFWIYCFTVPFEQVRTANSFCTSHLIFLFSPSLMNGLLI